jgi:hypothetical protein
MIQWYRTYSRQDFKLEFLDYELYDKNINGKEIIWYLDEEIKLFVAGEII